MGIDGSGLQFATTGSYGGANNLTGLVSGGGLKLKNMAGVYVGEDGESVTFTQTNGSTAYDATGNGGQPTVLINTTNATATLIAAAVAELINAQYSTDFTATPIDAEDYNRFLQSNIAVRIDMVTKGAVLDNISPVFAGESAYTFEPAAMEPFLGGATGTKKSAGDKAMDLYGILNNSTTQIGSKFAKRVTIFNPLYFFGVIAGAGTIGDIPGAVHDVVSKSHEKGYILGIQIPYNSMIQAGDGELYTARNFFMPTGGASTSGVTDYDKTSDSNTSPASAEMNWDTGEKAGIQGSVQKMDITYDAGETVYQFNMIFAPVDNLL
jgi:hypothetical protein